MMMRGFLSLIVCCLLWGTACSQVVYDITGVWVDGAGKTLQLRTLEGGVTYVFTLDFTQGIDKGILSVVKK